MRIQAPSAKSHSPRRPQGWLPSKTTGQCASVLIIVLWIALGLVSITLYFANSMSSELRASDNRASGIAAEQGIEGAARYLTYILSNFGDRKSTRLNSSHGYISYAVFCLKKKKKYKHSTRMKI